MAYPELKIFFPSSSCSTSYSSSCLFIIPAIFSHLSSPCMFIIPAAFNHLSSLCMFIIPPIFSHLSSSCMVIIQAIPSTTFPSLHLLSLISKYPHTLVLPVPFKLVDVFTQSTFASLFSVPVFQSMLMPLCLTVCNDVTYYSLLCSFSAKCPYIRALTQGRDFFSTPHAVLRSL
jgi:hypothetical protein